MVDELCLYHPLHNGGIYIAAIKQRSSNHSEIIQGTGRTSAHEGGGTSHHQGPPLPFMFTRLPVLRYEEGTGRFPRLRVARNAVRANVHELDQRGATTATTIAVGLGPDPGRIVKIEE